MGEGWRVDWKTIAAIHYRNPDNPDECACGVEWRCRYADTASRELQAEAEFNAVIMRGVVEAMKSSGLGMWHLMRGWNGPSL